MILAVLLALSAFPSLSNAGNANVQYKLLQSPLQPTFFKPRPGGNFRASDDSRDMLHTQNDTVQAAYRILFSAVDDTAKVTRKDIIPVLEPILRQDFGRGACRGGLCEEGWLDVYNRQAEVVYLSSLIDLSDFPRRVYIDGGAREYSSSVGGWFLSAYPQASISNFNIYAFEMESSYKKSYFGTSVRFMPYALWVADTRVAMYGSKMKSISGQHEKVKRYGRKVSVKGYAKTINFISWLLDNVSSDDYVVVKLDIEGAEHEVLQKLLNTEVVHVIDEMFVECHYNTWSKMRMDKRRVHCIEIISQLRSIGIVTHEWF